MEIKREYKITKRFDEHECSFHCSESAPLNFLQVCVEEFDKFIKNQIEEAKKNEAEKNKE